MKFPKIISRQEMIRAALFGAFTGIVGVLIFILLLNSMDTQSVQSSDEKLIPVSSQQTNQKEAGADDGTSEQFYAHQHGVFSSFDAATEFVYGYPSLNTSAVIEIDGQYYVWSSVTTTKEASVKIEDPPSFVKPFRLSANGCSKPEQKNIPTLLKSNDQSKFYFEGDKVSGDVPSDWQTINIALSSVSSDLSVVRMHLLAHYFTKNDCLKITF